MDILHNQIPTIQQRMTSFWSIYTEDCQNAERSVQAVVAELKVLVHIPELGNTNSANFVAPIRRLPVEMLAEISNLAIRWAGRHHSYAVYVADQFIAPIYNYLWLPRHIHG